MNYKIFLTGIILLFCFFGSNAQQWIRIYGDTVNTEVLHIAEQYDKGYLLSGKIYENAYFAQGLLIKTDINGYRIWQKTFGTNGNYYMFFNARITQDDGIIETGITNKLQTECHDPFIIKLNSCFEKEWCKIYNAPRCNCDGMDIESDNVGGYMALINRWKSGEQERIWLFRLDSLGEVIWSQVYVTNPAFFSEWSYSLIRTPDSCFLITGESYYPDPTYPGKSIIKIILIKVALDGTAVFEVPWGTNNGVYSDGRQSVVDLKNNIYTAGRRARTTAPGGDSPCLFKTSKNGNPVFYKDLKSTSSLGISTTINWFQDSSIVQCSYWQVQGTNDTTGLIKSDSLGNLIIVKPLLVNSICSFYGSDITYNNKLILTGRVFESGIYHSYAFKLTSDLEYDSVYTRPLTYDSLCPHPIVSDTVPLDDCEVVIVGLDDAEQHPEKTRLHIYPNPAAEQVTIVMPQYLVRQNPGSILSSTTTWFQWDKTRLDILSITGKLMFSQEVPKQQTTVQVNTSAWPAGMYFARVVFMNESVAEGKLVVD